MAAWQAKDFELARSHLEAALALNPGNRLYKANLKRLVAQLESDDESEPMAQ